MLLALALLLALQDPDPALAGFTAAVAAATEPSETVLRLEASDSDRVVLCSLTDTDMRCFRSTETREMRDGVQHLTARHVAPADYDLDDTTLADILASERAWLDSAP